MGSNSWPQYSLRSFVSLSARLGTPIIAVSINYRTNILGFLSSAELGATGNYGFKDQVLALKWVRRHIAGFGGDAANVTAAGESAGAISLSTIMCCVDAEKKDGVEGEGLFDRVILMSGDVTLRKPRTRCWHEGMYREQVGMLGLEGVSVQERVRRLRTWDAGDLVARLPLAQHFCGVIDGVWLRRDVRIDDLGSAGEKGGVHRPAWCREFVVGDTGDDVSINHIFLCTLTRLFLFFSFHEIAG